MDTTSGLVCDRFKRLGADTDVTVTIRRIVERFNVIRYNGRRALSVLVDLLLDPFLLQAAEQGFRTALPQQFQRRLMLGSR